MTECNMFVDAMNKLTFKERNEESFEDYTAVTDWEVFTQELENLLINWIIKQDTKVSTVCEHVQCCGDLKFGERIFKLLYCKCSNEFDKLKNHSSMTSENNSISKNSSIRVINPMPIFDGHFNSVPLVWFGLSHAFILKPDHGEIQGGTRLSLLLSSIEMAVYATRCSIPVLVEYHGPSYFGLTASSCLQPMNNDTNKYFHYTNNNPFTNALTSSNSNWIGSVNIDFTSCLIQGKILANCTHLNGLKEIFLTKLGYWDVNYPIPKLDISARFIYHLPSWSSLRTAYPITNSSIFSFDLCQRAALNLSFNFATTWPSLPSHTITEKPSWKSLKPEGAPISQLQLCTVNHPFVDHISLRIHRLLKVCSYDEQTIRRLIFDIDASSYNSSFDLSSDSVVQFLLFLFPDADAEGVCNKVLSNELTLSFGDLSSMHELLVWNRKPIQNSSERAKFASLFGLPNPHSLTHRLAIIIANLFIYKHCDLNDCLLLIIRMFNELYIELELRLDRLICLPASILYEEVFNNEEEEEFITSETSIDNPHWLPPLNKAWNDNALQLTIDQLPFNHWPIDCHYDWNCILNRFNECILKARESDQQSTKPIQSDRNDDDDDDEEAEEDDGDDEDAFFDAYDDDDGDGDDDDHDKTSSSCHDDMKSIHSKVNWLTSCSRNEALTEARTILDWLKSRPFNDHLKSLWPHILLECMLTFHSIISIFNIL
ncbi:unnamed protein product [Schistosoma turkestanicum]|nr:unnamed protein product [Schistosoma turkestanicum]